MRGSGLAKAYIIGIAGGSGAGKTTLINTLVEKTGPESLVVIRHDCYYKHHPHLSRVERSQINYDHPNALDTDLLTAQLKDLADGMPVEVPQYDYQTHLRRDLTRTVLPAKVIIVDGILIFTDKSLRHLMDLKIYVDADPDLRFIRRMERDIRHRGRTRQSVIDQYMETVRPMHHRFVEPCKSHADIIIPGDGRNPAALDLLAARINERQEN